MGSQLCVQEECRENMIELEEWKWNWKRNRNGLAGQN